MFYGRDPKVGIKYKVYFTRKRFYYLNEKILFKNGRFCSRAHYDYEVRMNRIIFFLCVDNGIDNNR